MKLAEIKDFAKRKRKEHRMKIDKIKKIARQHIRDSQTDKMTNNLTERCHHDARYSWG